MRRRYAAWLVGVLACSEAERAPDADLQELRLSTHRGLDPVVPPTGQTMSAMLVELVCPLAERAFVVRALGSGEFELTPRTGTRSLVEVAKLVRHVELLSVRAEEGRLVVSLKREADPRLLCIEDGPYRVSSQTPAELVLERRGDVGVPRIRVFNVRDSEEEWRRFLAREVDIVPGVNRSQLRYLRELPSVRLTPSVKASTFGLIFNVVTVPLDLRRAIALGIHRKAVVQTLGLDETLASPAQEDATQAEKLAGNSHPPASVRLITYGGDADMRRAALVVDENLNRLGLTTSVDAFDIPEILERQKQRAFDVKLFLVSYTAQAWWSFFRTGDRSNFTGYANPEFDAAALAGDAERVRSIMERDTLILPLFSVPDVIASDMRLCGIEPNLVDLVWLPGVHVCAPGEKE